MSRRVLSALAMAALGACSSTVELDINGHVPELEVLDEGSIVIGRSDDTIQVVEARARD